MLGDLKSELAKIDNTVRTVACTQPAFVKIISTLLTTKHDCSYDILEHCLFRLREKDFQLYRGLVVQPSRLSSIIKVCSSIDHLGLLMKEHHQYVQRSGYDYGEKVLELLNSQISQILTTFRNDEPRLFMTYLVDEFHTFKKLNNSEAKWTRIDDSTKELIDRKIYVMFEFVINPLLAFYSSKCSHKQMLQPVLVKWLLFLSNATLPERNKLILELSKRIQSLCSPPNEIKPPLANTFCLLMNFCELQYNDKELFDISDNMGLVLNFIHRDILPELTRTWLRGLRNIRANTYVNVCTNLVNTSVTVSSLRIIQTISNELKENCDFNSLQAIYDKVIKHKLSRCTFRKQGSLIIFLDIITFYVVGFINTQRLDDELEWIMLHYKSCVLYLSSAELETASFKMQQLLLICSHFFKNLTNTSRNISRELNKIYRKTPDELVVRDHVMHNKFPIDNNSPQDPMYMMQTTSRYVGLVNIGNTCYINSYVQALYMTKNFRTIMEDIDSQTPDSSQVEVVLSLLFHDATKRTPNITPFKFKSVLEEPFKTSQEQQDSAQFGRSLLQQLSRNFAKTLFEETLNETFTTCVNTIKSCLKCGEGGSQPSYLKQIILPTAANNEPIFLSESLRGIFAVENLGISDKVMCNRCNSKQEMRIKMVPQYFSSCLTFALNRFEYDKTKQTFIKKFNPINFEFDLDLSYCIPNLQQTNAIYELYAFIVHIGTTPLGGHYITYARNIAEDPNIWYTFDDAYVTQKEIITFDDFNLGEYDTPYILFYSSQTGKPVSARNINSKMTFSKNPSKHN